MASVYDALKLAEALQMNDRTWCGGLDTEKKCGECNGCLREQRDQLHIEANTWKTTCGIFEKKLKASKAEVERLMLFMNGPFSSYLRRGR